MKETEMNILIVRYICALILHLQLEGEVLQSLEFIKLIIHKVKPWKKVVPMMCVALMQFVSSLLTEFLNILLICSMTDLSDIIVNCVQFQMIAQIDDFYAGSQKNSFLLNLMRNSSLEICWTAEDKKRVEEKIVTLYHKVFFVGMKILYKAIRIFYSAVYFYFTPYLVVILSFVITENKIN